MTLTGASSAANYQAALRSVTYQNTSEKPSTATRTVTFTVNDGVYSSAPVTRQIAVTSVNDAPVNTVPGSQTGTEDTTVVFTGPTQISIGDVDAGTAAVQVTLSASNGKLTLSQTTGLTFVTGNGSGNVTMTFTGTVANINAALNGLRFDPNANFNGAASLQIVTNDQGNTGSGGPRTTSSTVAINVTAVNDAPTAGTPGTQSTPQNTELVFSSGTGNAITIDDVDAGAGILHVSLNVTNGTLTLGAVTGLSGLGGNATAAVGFNGSLADLNNALNGLRFTPTLSYNGPASLQITVDDHGNTGSGGAKNTIVTVEYQRRFQRSTGDHHDRLHLALHREYRGRRDRYEPDR